jgi:hypothetical protein
MYRNALVAVLSAAFLSLPVFASTFRVVDNHSLTNTVSPCTKAAFTTINAALAVSASGDTIEVCPGTYPETLNITIPITITGIVSGNNNQAILEPTTGISTTELDSSFPASTIILVSGVQKVYFNNIVVDGSLASTQNLSPGCSPDNLGIYYQNSTGAIYRSVVRYIGLMPGNVLTGCQEGQGIYADSGNGGATTLAITWSSVHDYNKNGITANDIGTSLDSESNTVSGSGPNSIVGQNGIQVYLAKGKINENIVLDNNYVTPPGGTFYTATNILLYQPANGVTVTKNTSAGSNSNIVQYLGNDGTFTSNVVSRAFDTSTETGTGAYGSDGIDIYGNGNTVTSNTIIQSQTNAIFLCGSNNKVHSNDIYDATYGVYEDQSNADSCGSSGSNSATSNTLEVVQTQYTPYNSTLPNVVRPQDAARAQQSQLPHPLPMK